MDGTVLRTPYSVLATQPLRRFSLLPLFLLGLSICTFSFGNELHGPRLGPETASRWRIGVTVKAAAGPVTGICATMAVPKDWPEQTVSIVSEDKSPNVGGITFRPLDDGVRLMSVAIPRLAASEEASAIVTFEIKKRHLETPSETNVYRLPKTAATLAKTLNPSPFIESKDTAVVALAAKLTRDVPGAWQKAETIFDWVRANVKYEFAEQIKPATAALQDGVGDCEELSSLFIALCRASKIPARAVWVPGHTYPEFYLADEQGRGHWFPCQAAGADREFGGLREDRPILQKGDNFTVPGERGPQRYVKQSLTAKDAAGPPEVKFVLERVE